LYPAALSIFSLGVFVRGPGCIVPRAAFTTYALVMDTDLGRASSPPCGNSTCRCTTLPTASTHQCLSRDVGNPLGSRQHMWTSGLQAASHSAG